MANQWPLLVELGVEAMYIVIKVHNTMYDPFEQNSMKILFISNLK